MVCCFVAMPAFAVNDNCPATGKLELQGLQNGKDDEFIYTNQDVYKEVLDCYSKYGAGAGKKSCNLKAGQVYECDNQQGCSDRVYLFGEYGWVHGRNGNDVGNKILMCMSKGTQDHWSVNDWKECSKQYTVFPDKIPGQYWTKIKFKNNDSRKCYSSSTQGYCCLDEEYANCLAAEHAIWSVEKQECLCGGTESGAQTTGLWRWNGTKCVEYNEGSEPIKPQPKTCDGTPDGGTQTSKGENCENYMTNAEHVAWCYRTCNQGEWTDWQIHECENGYKKVDNKCVKKNSEPSEPNQPSQPTQPNVPTQPVQPTVPTPQPVQPTWSCVVPNFGNYGSCPEAGEAINLLEEYCQLADRTEDGYNSRVANINRLITGCKQDAENAQRIADLTKGLFSKYDEMTGDVSVWKNKEGEFNTARLASDSIAGVVLGTAGGLITSNVVKKSQVKSGFEDVQCTIGGQKVADWGDEFTVGIQ